MKPQHSTETMIDSLKGIAIVAVIVNHYVNIYLSKAFVGYANGAIAVFFVFSGYGNFYSLEKYNKIDFSAVVNFWTKRAVRIYPLFWLSMLITGIIHRDIYSVSDYLLPNFRVQIIYWFLNAILQCYLIAPFLYLLLKRVGCGWYLLVCTAAVFFINISPLSSILTNEPVFTKYKFLLMIHLLLFAVGMSLPSLVRKKNNTEKNNLLIPLVVLFFTLGIELTRRKNVLFLNSQYIFVPLFCASVFFFCLTLIPRRPSFPFKRLFTAFGKSSFSIYLFHLSYFFLISKIVFSKQAGYIHMVLTIAIFPIFFILSAIADRLVQRLYVLADR